jgi:predicted PurR-regulated permease PerM
MEDYLVNLLIAIIIMFITGEFFNKMEEIFNKKIFQFLSVLFYILFILGWLSLIVYGVFLMVK